MYENFVFMLVPYREFVSLVMTSGLHSTLILTTVAVKNLVDIGARPHVCAVFVVFLMFVLILPDGLCCAWFIYPILCWCWCWEKGTSSIDWVHLSRLLPEDGDRMQSPKVVCFK
jgi:hypothetical protein